MAYLNEVLEVVKSGVRALQNPTDNPAAALFTIAAAVLVMLIVVLGGYLVLVLVEGRGEDSGKSTKTEPHKPSGPWRNVLTTLIFVVSVGLLAFGWNYSASDEFCGKCHFTERAIDSHAAGTHSTVPCRKCHIAPGISSGILVRIRGLDNLSAHIAGVSDEIKPAQIENTACLRCHESVLEGVSTARSVRIRHSDLLEIGHACTDCHNTEGHGKEVARVRYPRMGQCIACHDGERVSAECDDCHSADVGVAVRRPARPYAQTAVDKEDCRGCHPMDSCIECHELELPHSKQFIEGYHALKGYTQHEICVGCHDIKAFCNGCHQFQVDGFGARDWKRYHVSQGVFEVWHGNPNNPGIRECACHELDRQKFCDYCHGPQPER